MAPMSAVPPKAKEVVAKLKKLAKDVWKQPLKFIDGGHSGDDSRWVTAEDSVTATLLQARLSSIA